MIISIHGKCTNQTCIYGQCIDNECACDAGVRGDKCNLDVIDCDRDSCFNDGICIELVNGFACQCLPGFYGLRCQYRRKISDNYCKKKCAHNSKCVIINNTEKCLCSSTYYGSKCEHPRTNNSSPLIRECSLLKFRNSNKEGTCLAISLTELFDVHCECRRDDKNKHSAYCLITPSPYSKQKCFFKRSIHSLTLSLLVDPISIHVCPVNWQILDQYENIKEIVNSAHKTKCHLY